MADNQKYYYMRLKENFFDSDSMILLESLQDGYIYSNILLKLYLRSLKDEGRLMLNGRIPYNAQMLASITRTQVGTIEKAISIFKELGLIEILDSGAIYMLDIQNYIGKTTTAADRQRVYDRRIADEKLQLSPACKESDKKSCKKSDKKSVPKIEIELDTDIELEKSKKRERFIPPTVEEVAAYCNEKGYTSVDPELFVSYYDSNNWMIGKTKMKKWQSAVVTWVKREAEKPKANKPAYSRPAYKQYETDDIDLSIFEE